MVLQLLNPEREYDMQRDERGYFHHTVEQIDANCRYFFVADGKNRMPDPASNYQPEGVHGCSQVVDHASFPWTDSMWKGLPFCELVLYELHVGTFTPEGTFEAIIPRLEELKSCGINAIELMPVSQFPGARNWGYDCVFPYAVQNTYGGPRGLKGLVDACHQHGISVILDLVFNHLGPEGNYLPYYGPYFTDRYKTPWGEAINFDGEWSDSVRDYFAGNAWYWFQHYHVDGLRMDAIHMVFDHGAVHFWQYVSQKVRSLQSQSGRSMHLIAESDLNSPAVVNPMAIGGYGFTAQWLDDFHHALYVMLDSRGRDRYEDFGLMSQLLKAYKEGFVHSGEYVKFRKRKHGMSSAGMSGNRFVAFTSNHDQIGNRPDGGRLSRLIDFQRMKLAAAALIMSPYIPMLFMGEEYGEENPFYYFISHSDPDLIEAVRKGRKEEFSAFKTQGEWPDPQDEKTFRTCILNWESRNSGRHAVLRRWYQELISRRKKMPALRNPDKNDLQAFQSGESALVITRRSEDGLDRSICVFNFADEDAQCDLPVRGILRKVIDSREKQWNHPESEMPLAPHVWHGGSTATIPALSFCLYQSSKEETQYY